MRSDRGSEQVSAIERPIAEPGQVVFDVEAHLRAPAAGARDGSGRRPRGARARGIGAPGDELARQVFQDLRPPSPGSARSGVRATQRERVVARRCTDSMKAMKRGAFSRRRKNAYTSSGAARWWRRLRWTRRRGRPRRAARPLRIPRCRCRGPRRAGSARSRRARPGRRRRGRRRTRPGFRRWERARARRAVPIVTEAPRSKHADVHVGTGVPRVLRAVSPPRRHPTSSIDVMMRFSVKRTVHR